MGAGDSQAGLTNLTRGSMNDNEQAASLKMQVPERILVAGGNSHVAAKNLPRELQFENSVLSPSPEQVRHSEYIIIKIRRIFQYQKLFH